MAVEVVADRLYAAGGGTLYVLSITEPGRPVLLGKLPGLGTTRQLFVQDHVAYVTARQAGLWLVDVSQAASREQPIRPSRRLRLWHGRLVIPAAYQGLLVERTAAR